MFTATAKIAGATVTLTAETLEALYLTIFDLNADVFVGDTQVAARNGKLPGKEGYFAGYTRGGLAKLFGVTVE